jgi:hypothetical protein
LCLYMLRVLLDFYECLKLLVLFFVNVKNKPNSYPHMWGLRIYHQYIVE